MSGGKGYTMWPTLTFFYGFSLQIMIPLCRETAKQEEQGAKTSRGRCLHLRTPLSEKGDPIREVEYEDFSSLLRHRDGLFGFKSECSSQTPKPML